MRLKSGAFTPSIIAHLHKTAIRKRKALLFQLLFLRVLRCEEDRKALRASPSHALKDGGSDHQNALGLIGEIQTKVFYFCLIAVTEVIEAQAVLLLVHNGAQLGL